MPNGDILYINEEYGEFELWESTYQGIQIYLDSGNEFISYLMIPSNLDSWPNSQESGYGVFYDLNNLEYEDGNIIKVYDLGGDDQLYNHDAMWQRESSCRDYGINCTCVLVIKNGYWVLTNESRYIGKTLTLASGDEIYVSGITKEDGIGLYFTNSNGRNTTAYYMRGTSQLAHTSFGWFSPMIPQNGDEIRIHMYAQGQGYDNFYEEFDYTYSDEDVVETEAPLYCVLKVVDGEWTIEEDYSND